MNQTVIKMSPAQGPVDILSRVSTDEMDGDGDDVSEDSPQRSSSSGCTATPPPRTHTHLHILSHYSCRFQAMGRIRWAKCLVQAGGGALSQRQYFVCGGEGLGCPSLAVLAAWRCLDLLEATGALTYNHQLCVMVM